MERWGIGRRQGSLGLVVSMVVAMVAGLVVGLPARAVADATWPSGPGAGPVPPAGPATPNQSFVQATYRDFLGRPPQTYELMDQAARLQSGQVSISSYLSGLSTSDEWLSTIVTGFYRDTLQRDPEPSGLAGWVAVLRSGQMSVDQVASYFYASEEFYQRFGGGSLSPWVTQLYQKLLGRAPDQGGLENWVRNADRFGRPWVTLYFYQSAESRSRRVQGLYQALLQRDPDPTGWPYWTDGLLMWSDLTLASLLASSQEYWDNSRTRFPMFPGPPKIGTTTLPDGLVGAPYSATISATEGVPPYTWTPGALPAGLTMDQKTGVISGTPTEPAVNLQVNVYIYDAAGGPGMATYSLNIFQDPVVGTASLQYAVAGTPYTVTLATSAGSSPPYTWAATGLPSGISLAPATGVLSGTSTALGSYPITLTVTDARGKTAQKTLTLPVQDNVAVQQVSVGAQGHSCALTVAGGVRCWGNDPMGAQAIPMDVVGLSTGVVSISAGSRHTCALTAAGGVKCWGKNYNGELGDGTFVDSSVPVDVVGLSSGVKAITAGTSLTCALTTAGGVKCWGWNANGALGDGTVTSSATPRDVIGLSSGVAAISAGVDHACAVTTRGAVKCWGDNGEGRLGDGTNVNRSTPVDVVGMDAGVVSVSAGSGSTCAVTSGGEAKCWGLNLHGELGDGTKVDRWTPVSVTGLTSGVAGVGLGYAHACAVTGAGAVLCWGNNSWGGLGDGTIKARLTPVGVVGLSNGVAAVGSSFTGSCALTSIGGVKCWGGNSSHELGDGVMHGISTKPVDVYGLKFP